MSIQSICRYIYILTISTWIVCGITPAFAQADAETADATTEQKVKKPDSAGHQLCIGIDAVRIGSNFYYTDRTGYELHADYYLKKEFYIAGEGGWGNSAIDYTDLKYTTTNSFVQLGFNKSILTRDHPRDWDMMFMGLRAGFAQINRSTVSYMVEDKVWGNTAMQSLPGKNYSAFWLELTGGMRVELYKGLFAGWNIRGKFLMNGKSFREMAPMYIAGFGRGDKTANFVFNLYLSYGIRWDRTRARRSE